MKTVARNHYIECFTSLSPASKICARLLIYKICTKTSTLIEAELSTKFKSIYRFMTFYTTNMCLETEPPHQTVNLQLRQ